MCNSFLFDTDRRQKWNQSDSNEFFGTTENRSRISDRDDNREANWNRCRNDWHPCCNDWNRCGNGWNPCCNDWNRCGNDWNPRCNDWNRCGNGWNPCCNDWNHCGNSWNPCCNHWNPCCNNWDPCGCSGRDNWNQKCDCCLYFLCCKPWH